MAATLLLRVFVSSPGDVAEERAQTEQVLLDLAKAYSRHLRLEPVFWEHEPLFVDAGFQDQLPLPGECDLVIVLLWSRIGSRLPAKYAPEPGRPAPTGTEFEIRDALDARARHGRPQLLVYLKTASILAGLDEAGTPERIAQYERLKTFVAETFHDADGAGTSAYHTFRETAAFPALLRRHVEAWLKRHLADRHVEGTQRIWTTGSPFRRLEPFDAEHRAVYFGRSAATSAVLGLLRQREAAVHRRAAGLRCLVVHGLSGNGKSSLIRAGVLPLVRIGALDGVGLIRQAVTSPSAEDGNVFLALARALHAALPEIGHDDDATSALATDLAAGAHGTPLLLRSVVATLARAQQLEPDHARVVLVIDQLEELFADPELALQAESAGRALDTLARSGIVWIVATLRSDFTHHLERTDAWRAISREAAHFTLHKPSEDELAEMVREPARVAGLRYEERDGTGLDRRILDAARNNTESLPLVEFVLDELWKRYDARPADDGELRHADYEALGELTGALQRAAEQVFAKVGGDDAARQSYFRNVMRQLVRIGEGENEGKALRRDAALDHFKPGSGERELVDALVDARLCVADATGRPAENAAPTVRVAHEALLSGWDRVQEWLQRDGELLRIRERLQRDADEWQRHDRRRDLLASGAKRLGEIRAIDQSGMELPDTVAAFIERSQERAARQRHARIGAAGALLLLAVAMSVLAVFALRSRQQERTRFVETAALQLAADAKANFSANGDEEKAIRQLLAARSLGTGVSFERDIHDALAHQMSQRKTFANRAAITTVRYETQGHRLLSAHVDGSLRFWNPQTRRELLAIDAHADAINALAIDATGARVFTASDDGTVRQWSGSDGRAMGTVVDIAPARVLGIALDASGTRLAIGASDGTMRIWDTAGGRLLAGPIEAHRGEVVAVAVIPGKPSRFVSAGEDGAARRWNVDGTVIGAPMAGRGGGIKAIAVSPDGRTLAVGNDNATITVWDLDSGAEPRPPLRGHVAAITALSFGDDSLRLVSGSTDQTVRIWDLATVAAPRVLGDSGSFVRSVAISPDGTHAAIGSYDGTLEIRDARPAGSAAIGTRLGATGEVNVVFSADSRRLLSYRDGGDGFDIRDGRTGRLVCRFGDGNAPLESPQFDPQMRRVVALRTATPDATAHAIAFWDAETCAPHAGEIRIPAPMGRNDTADFRFLDAGRRILFRAGDTAQNFDAQTLQPVGVPRTEHVTAMSTDGDRYVTESFAWDGFDAKTGTPTGPTGAFAHLRAERLHYDAATDRVYVKRTSYQLVDGRTGGTLGEPVSGYFRAGSATFNRDGTRLLVTTEDATVWLFDGTTHVAVAAPLDDAQVRAGVMADWASVQLRNDTGKFFLFDLRQRKNRAGPFRHTDEVTPLRAGNDRLAAWLPRGRSHWLIDSATGRPIALKDAGSANLTPQFSADGSHLGQVVGDTVKLWSADDGRLATSVHYASEFQTADSRVDDPVGAGAEHELARHGAYSVTAADATTRSALRNAGRVVIEFVDPLVTAEFSPDGESLLLSDDDDVNLVPAPHTWARRLCTVLGDTTINESLDEFRPTDIEHVDPCTQ